MGFSRHWYRPAEIDPERYERIRFDMLRFLAESHVPFAGWNGRVSFSRDGQEDLRFNGRAYASCETFAFPRVLDLSGWSRPYQIFDGVRLYHQFCKTRQYPYDRLVQGCLIIAKHHLGKDFFISDGDEGIDAPSWSDAQKAVQAATGIVQELREIEDEVAVVEPWPELIWVPVDRSAPDASAS